MISEMLVIRADAGADIGIGHVMRCLALAEAWQDAGGKVVFALASGIAQVGGRLGLERMNTAEIRAAAGSDEDATLTAELCRKVRTAWLVLDGFQFSLAYRRRVRSGPDHLLVLDDHGAFAPYECDVVLNTNPYASDEMYPRRGGGARFLLGPKFALLRREFMALRHETSPVPEVARKILVTFGGSDPHNVTLRVIDALRQLVDVGVEATVVVGSSSPHRSRLEESVRGFPKARVLFNPESMPQLMASTELAISAGGGTCYELAFERVPMFLITMAENHEQTVKAWGVRRAAIDAGWFHQLSSGTLAARLRDVMLDPVLRSKLVENAAGIVDGMGASRVVATMLGRPMELSR
jgi:UDP-2,4-diacetamido-2,4,6-trideoxy-beta-L-altropyranose hydrolase